MTKEEALTAIWEELMADLNARKPNGLCNYSTEKSYDLILRMDKAVEAVTGKPSSWTKPA